MIGKMEEESQQQMRTVRMFSDDIHVEFELDNCATTVLQKGKLFHLPNLILDINREIQEHECGKTYKYLGNEVS
jgi:hypothetical protein